MNTLELSPKQLAADAAIQVPPSKSQTLRALFFALLAEGTSKIENPLESADVDSMIVACETLGARISKSPGLIIVDSPGGIPKRATNVIDAGNSGIIYRFITALAAQMDSYTVITGDTSIRTRRPIVPLLTALQELGAFATTSSLQGHAPIIVQGPMRAGNVTIEGRDSQPVSALIYSAMLSDKPTTIQIKNLAEKPWINLSLSWLDRFGIPYERPTEECIHLYGGASLSGFHYRVPGDFSSCAPLLAHAVIQNQSLTLSGLDMTDTQGDKILIELLQNMGADIQVTSDALIVNPHRGLRGTTIDCDACIDLIPILAVIGCFAAGETHLINGSIAAFKESNRLEAITSELKKMGAEISCDDSSVHIKQSRLHGAVLEAHADHRIAMACAVASANARTPSSLVNPECVSKTFPHFFSELARISTDGE